jgi:protein gp37
LIRATQHLDWLLLTKRIGNAKAMLPTYWGDGYPNVWLGASIVNQPEADRDVIKLLSTPARIHFLSCEPLLGPINLGLDLGIGLIDGTRWTGNKPAIDWVIVGGESGHHARPMESDWAQSLKTQCAAAGVAFFMKQGSQANWPQFKDFESFPPSLQVRQWPK